MGVGDGSHPRTTYTQAILRMGISMSFASFAIFKFQTKKIGSMPNVKSHTADTAEYRYVKLIMTYTLTQVPPSSFLSQKNEMGAHCKRVTKKKTTPVRTVRPMTSKIILRPDCDAQEEESDGNLCRNHGQTVGQIANPPITEGFIGLLVREDTCRASCAVVNPADYTGCKHDVS
jgi:hypothetical protein